MANKSLGSPGKNRVCRETLNIIFFAQHRSVPGTKTLDIYSDYVSMWVTKAFVPPPGPKRNVRQMWNMEEKSACRRQFGRFIYLNRLPGKAEILRCVACEPTLKNRSWLQVKHFVRNKIEALKKTPRVLSLDPWKHGHHRNSSWILTEQRQPSECLALCVSVVLAAC